MTRPAVKLRLWCEGQPHSLVVENPTVADLSWAFFYNDRDLTDEGQSVEMTLAMNDLSLSLLLDVFAIYGEERLLEGAKNAKISLTFASKILTGQVHTKAEPALRKRLEELIVSGDKELALHVAGTHGYVPEYLRVAAKEHGFETKLIETIASTKRADVTDVLEL